MKFFKLGLLTVTALVMTGCIQSNSQTAKDKQTVNAQQKQYAAAQPVPVYDWSLERDLLIKIYNLRNEKVATHSVWRSDYGTIEGNCPSMGYGIPYDTSLTNPQKSTNIDEHGNPRGKGALTSVGQAEPNGVFASTNTAATWVLCVGKSGNLEPHYVESKVTVYPYNVKVNYETNQIKREGKATASFSK